MNQIFKKNTLNVLRVYESKVKKRYCYLYFAAHTSQQCKIEIEKPCLEISIDQFILFCCSPHSPETLNTLRHQLHVASNNVSQSHSAALSPNTVTGQSSPSVYFGLSRRGSLSSVAGMYCVIAWKTGGIFIAYNFKRALYLLRFLVNFLSIQIRQMLPMQHQSLLKTPPNTGTSPTYPERKVCTCVL